MKFKFTVLLFLGILSSQLTWAQKNILMYSNQNSNLNFSKLQAKCRASNLNLTIKNTPEVLEFNNLAKYDAVVFYDFDIDKISLIENNALLNYSKIGGSLGGIGNIFSKKIKWVWYSKLFGKNCCTINPEKNIDVISMKTFENVPPMWKINDESNKLVDMPKLKNTLLMDFEGNILSWMGKSDIGNLCFYSAIGHQQSALENEHLLNFWVDNFKELVKNKLDLTLLKPSDILSQAEHFKVVELFPVDSVSVISVLPNNQMILYKANGNIAKYDFNAKTIQNLGVVESLKNAVGITPDPDFVNNGLLYFYFPLEGERLTVKRLKIENELITDEFQSESNMNNLNQILYNKEAYLQNKFALPDYYNAKIFYISPQKTFWIRQEDADKELLNQEEFVVPLQNIQSFGINNGELVFLQDQKIKKLIYAENQEFPPVADFQFTNLSPKFPAKIKFEATNKKLDNNYTWKIGAKVLKGSTVEYLCKKPIEISVTLVVKTISSLEDRITKKVSIR